MQKAQSSLDLLPYTQPLQCLVCGDGAEGYHYGVSSCNGCKTFFRRTILDKRVYTCKKDGNCFLSFPKEQLRCACRACRYNKCVDVGMNPFSIQVKKSLPAEESTRIIKEIMRKRLSGEFDDAENFPKRLKLLFTEWPRSEIPVPQKLMIAMEECYNNEGKCVGNGEVYFSYYGKRWLFYDILCSIEYIKTFPFYQKLTKQDKKTLLRAVSLTTCNLTEAFYSYTMNCTDILYPDGTKSAAFWAASTERKPRVVVGPIVVIFCRNMKYDLSLLKEFTTFIEPILYHRKALDCLRRIGISKIEYVLIKSILLCNAGTLEMSPAGKTEVLQEQKRVTDILFNYCLNEHGPSNGPSRFTSLIGIVDVLERMAREQRDLHKLARIARPNKQDLPLTEEVLCI